MSHVNYMDTYQKVYDDFKDLQEKGLAFNARNFIEQQMGTDREELVTLIEVFCTSQPHIKTKEDVAQSLLNFLTIVKILDEHHEEEITTLRLSFIDVDVDLTWDNDLSNTINSN